MDLLAPLVRYGIAPIWWMRGGEMRFSYLRQLEKSQWLLPEQIHANQLVKLKRLLTHAMSTVPYYAQIAKERAFSPEAMRSLDDLRHLPLLTKSDIIKHKQALLSSTVNAADLLPACTGGSTGTQLHFFIDKTSNCMKNACTWRHNRWAAWDIGDRVAAVWGNPKLPTTVREKLRAALLARHTYLDTMHMTPETMQAFAHALQRWRPFVIYGHAHSIYLFAEFIKSSGLHVPVPAGIITTSMMLLDHERLVIEQALGCAVTNRYGCEEVSLIACECQHHNGMHLNLDHLVVEFIKEDGSPAQSGQEGRIVLTDLTNYGMPFIRYEVGDIGVPTGRACPCGRGLPLMEKVSGRVADFLVRMDGSKVAGISLVERLLTNISGIQQMQIVQNTKDLVAFNVVKRHDFCEQTETTLKAEFASIFPGSAILITYVQAIVQERNGKYRFAICNVK